MSHIEAFNGEAAWQSDAGWGMVATETKRRLARPIKSGKLSTPRRHSLYGNGKGRRRHPWMIGGVGPSAKILIWTLSGMAAATALSLVVLLKQQGMIVPATSGVPAGMGRVEVPSSARDIGGTPHPTAPSTHRSMRGSAAGDSFGGGSSDFSRHGAPTRPGEGGMAAAKMTVGQRDQRARLGKKSKGTWRDINKNSGVGAHAGERGNSHYEESLPPPPLGGSETHETPAEANEKAIQAQNEALEALQKFIDAASGGGAWAGGGGGVGGRGRNGGGGGGGGGGSGNTKKKQIPISDKALPAAEGAGAPAGGGGNRGDNAGKKKALLPPKASRHVTRTADREVLAEQAVLEIISRGEGAGQQQRRETQ